MLCLTNRQWVIVHEAGKRALEVAQAGFTDTLSVELTVVLLYGKLKIDYAGKDRSGSGVCYFNTVMEGLYTNVIEQALNSIDGVWPPSEERDKRIRQDLEDWPLKFRNYGWFYLPPGSKLFNAVNWPTVFGRFGREFAAAGALFLTDRHLVVITEERSRSWFQKKEDRTRYGAIIYLPPAHPDFPLPDSRTPPVSHPRAGSSSSTTELRKFKFSSRRNTKRRSQDYCVTHSRLI